MCYSAGKGHPLQSPDEATGNLREDLLIAISQAEEVVFLSQSKYTYTVGCTSWRGFIG